MSFDLYQIYNFFLVTLHIDTKNTTMHPLREETPLRSGPWIESSLVELGIWQEQEKRREKVNSICTRMNRSVSFQLSSDMVSRLIVSDKSKLLFSFIPKVACKTWKELLVNMIRVQGGNKRKPMMNSNWVLSDFDRDGRERRLKEYKKVVFVRNPMVRVLSAYLSKLKNFRDLQRHWEYAFGVDILRKYRPNSTHVVEEALSIPFSQRPFLNVTFAEFIQFITDRETNITLTDLTDHWLPQHIVSHVCEIGYDFIGKYENLAVEAPFVLEWLGLTSITTFPDIHESNAVFQMANEYLNIPVGHLQALLEYYSQDMEFFGYDAIDDFYENFNETLRLQMMSTIPR